MLIPGQIAGVAAGFALLSVANADMIAVAIASLTLIFAASWFMRGGKIVPKPRSPAKGVVAGVASGVSSMVAHSGGPPVAMYLLPLGLSKSVYAGTTFMFFVVGNYLKVGPWLMLVEPTRDWWMLLALSLPVIPLGVWSGWRLHERLDQTQLYRACYVLLSIVGMKLLWDGLYGQVTG